MYYPIPEGSVEIIENCGYKYECQLPPIGYGKNRLTGEIQYIGVRSVSTKKSEQIWQPHRLPKDWVVRRKKEITRQKADPDYFDPDLEKIRNQWWLHRLCGEWVTINGKETYIPGSYWYYLDNCPLDVGLPSYRNTDRKLYYVWEYCCEDPRCAGLIDVERRRMGKTFKSGSIVLDRTSLYRNHHSGIQSKTSTDSKGVFLKTIVNFFKKSVEFFRPIYDQSKGVTPTSELKFFQTVVKGKKAESVLEGEELESWIDWGSSDIFFYDGSKLGTYLMDEFGKTMECDVWDRWNVVRFCLDQDGVWVGRAILTSTIEDLESGGSAAKKLWDASDPSQRDKNGRTQSGLYRFFLPAYETTFFDKFGMPEEERAKEFYLNQRAGLQDDPRALSSIIRKNPFTIQEAFRVDGDKCLFNSEKLNNRRDELSWMDVTEKGNLEWIDKNNKELGVEWVKKSNGRWKICKGFQFDDNATVNNVRGRQGWYKPMNTAYYVAGCDPYDHNQTQDNRRSNGALYVKKKHVPGQEDNAFNNAFVVRYNARPSNAGILYDDFLKTCYYFGCELLVESQKPGVMKYFTDNGFEEFLVTLPGYKEPGIPSSQPNKQILAELTEKYIDDHIDKVYFSELCDDWLEFDINETQKYDDAMAVGWTELADKYKLVPKKSGTVKDITTFFKLHNVG